MYILYSYHTRDAALTTFFRVRSEVRDCIYIILLLPYARAQCIICKLRTCYNASTDRPFTASDLCVDKNRRKHTFPVVTNRTDEHNQCAYNNISSSTMKHRCPDDLKKKIYRDAIPVHYTESSCVAHMVLITLLFVLTHGFYLTRVLLLFTKKNLSRRVCIIMYKNEIFDRSVTFGRLRRNTHGSRFVKHSGQPSP